MPAPSATPHAPRPSGRALGPPPPRRAALAAALAALVLTACGRTGPPRSVLLVTLDTTRADALGCYGGAYPVSPSLDRLAGMGIVFERATSPVPLTLPAHASLLTGLYPPRHTLRANGDTLPASALTLAEEARAAGIQTAAFVGASVLAPELGLEQGFETYVAPGPREAEGRGERPAAQVASEALAWLERRDPERPFLLWIHFFDAHDPYEPPARFRPRAGVHPYYGEIAAADAALGGVLAWLDGRGLLEHTTVLVAGDHGEGLGDHGEATHGDYCFESTLHVPLVVAGPGLPRGERSAALVSLVDVAPTLAHALGLGWPEGGDGRDLLAAPSPERGVYFECYTGYLSYGWSPLGGWRDATGKLVASARPSFFHPSLDPAELHDCIDETDTSAHRAAIRALFELPVLERAGDEGPDPEQAQHLRAIGYGALGSGQERLPSPLDDTGRPAPSERTEEHARALAGMAAIAEGRFAEAEALFARIVADSPAHLAAWDRLAYARFAQGEFAASLTALDELLARGPERAHVQVARAECLWELERRDEALAAFERAAELAPRSPTTLEPLAVALTRLGRAAEAEAVRARLRAAEERP